MIKLPNIEVTFKQLAGSLIERSERGIAVLIVKDDTNKNFTYKEYSGVAGVEKDKDLYSPENLQYIRDAFSFSLSKVAVARIDKTGGSTAEALETIEKNIKTGWITVAEGSTEDWAVLSSWIKTKEQEKKTYKAVAYKAITADCKHLVNFFNDSVTFADSRGKVSGEKYCPTLIGMLASCNVKKGATYFKCSNLTRVEETADNEAAVGAGKFILVNDVDTVKVALGINSLISTDGKTATEDMKYIDTVEAMDLIQEDISNVFKNEYLGSYKNNYDNQILLISAVNTYFKQLAEDNILDNSYNNKADVDVEAQRLAWLGTGKAEANDWKEQEVKNNSFKRTVFLAGDIKILGAMENLSFNINLL